jgi:hypothetical protein
MQLLELAELEVRLAMKQLENLQNPPCALPLLLQQLAMPRATHVKQLLFPRRQTLRTNTHASGTRLPLPVEHKQPTIAAPDLNQGTVAPQFLLEIVTPVLF